LKNRNFLRSSLIAFLIFITSLVLNYFAANYATKKAGNFVTDIILDNIRVFNVSLPFVWGPIVIILIVIGILLRYPFKTPFLLKSTTLFIIIRSLFITLTHFGPMPIRSPLPSSIVIFSPGGDLFFSGHTGMPFLFALLFWDKIYLRLIFLIFSVSFGILVLLGHLHYSVDVLAAFFITFTIYHLAISFFKKDWEWFNLKA